MKEIDKCILIDKKVARNILHHFEHLKIMFVPEEIEQMEFILRTGEKASMKRIYDDVRKRVGVIAEYLRMALEGGVEELKDIE